MSVSETKKGTYLIVYLMILQFTSTQSGEYALPFIIDTTRDGMISAFTTVAVVVSLGPSAKRMMEDLDALTCRRPCWPAPNVHFFQ